MPGLKEQSRSRFLVWIFWLNPFIDVCAFGFGSSELLVFLLGHGIVAVHISADVLDFEKVQRFVVADTSHRARAYKRSLHTAWMQNGEPRETAAF
jgi:hypothetical protein